MALDKSLSAFNVLLYQVRAGLVAIEALVVRDITASQDIDAIRFSLQHAYFEAMEVAIAANKANVDEQAAEEPAALYLH